MGGPLGRADAVSALRTDPGLPGRYSEWHHFTFHDAAAGVHGICNLALSGDVRDPDRSRAGLSLVVSEGARWRGTMNLYGTEEAAFEPGTVDLAVGPGAAVLEDGRYRVRAALKDGSVALDAVWSPRAEALRVDSIGGMVSTCIVPRLDVEGTVAVDGRTHRLAGTGYHDHNWGYWEWGRDLGWNWGYVADPSPERPRTVVFGQVTDAGRAAARSDMVVAVWEDERWSQAFLDDAVRVTADGDLPLAGVPRVPGVLAAIEGRRRPVPRRLGVRAEDGEQWLELSLDVGGALQFLVPHAGGDGTTTVSELLGTYDVKGALDGEPIGFSAPGFAELAG